MSHRMKRINTNKEKKTNNRFVNIRINSMIKIFFTCYLLLATCYLTHAQTADQIETLLHTQAVTNRQAANFVLQAAEAQTQDAFNYAQNQKWLPKNATPNAQINLKQASLLIMQAFKIKGGQLYVITKSAHYAYRELVYKDIIQGRADPSMKVSGELLLFLVNRVLYMQDENPWEIPEDRR